MPVVQLQPDTLNAENAKFAQTPLSQPAFLNSVPKCGTHLVRNIFRMFVPVAQQYHHQFIQWGNLQQHLRAFDARANMFSWGHLLYSDASVIELKGVRTLVLVRDPYSWVLARARFFLSDEFKGNIEAMKGGAISPEQFMNLMIFGIYQKAPPLREIYDFNAASWLGTGAHLVRYEDVVRHLRALETDEAERYFRDLFAAFGIASLPSDWRDRVRIGADRKFSGTARENLTGMGLSIPDELPDAQKRLVDYAAPGLRALLGYA
jgi:hypothetical protein